MASSILGYGAAPYGASHYAFGSAATSDAPGVPAIGEGRFINPDTRDYEIDTVTPAADGNLKRQSSAPQLVYLALITVRDSSGVVGLGLDQMPDRIRPTLQADVGVAVARALQHLTSKRLVELVAVDFATTTAPVGRAIVRVRWRDLTTGLEHVNAL